MLRFLIYIIMTFSLLSAVFLTVRHRRISRERTQTLLELQKRVVIFLSEFDRIKTQFVSESEEADISQKWREDFFLAGKCRVLRKARTFPEAAQFYRIYKNLHRIISESNAEIRRKEEIRFLAERAADFFDEISALTNEYAPHSAELRLTQKWKEIFQRAQSADIRAEDAESEEIARFKKAFEGIHGYLSAANEQFVRTESQKYDAFFSDIGGKSLDDQQREAVITDEDRTLVLAGAGSGKTLTIAAKVSYLCKVKHVHPAEILLISYTKKSAEEMTERVQGKLGIPAEATTFHRLGLDIIKRADGRRPDVCDDTVLAQFIHQFFENDIVNHPDLIQSLTEYFACYLEIPGNMENYSSLGELYEAEKSADLETLRSKYERGQFIRKTGAARAATYTTLNNEKVRSLEETKIANFLFINGIRYEYEKPYPFESSGSLRKRYRPDFYLSDYDIYLEHFGISKDFRAPWLSEAEEKKYLDGIEWKRALHKANRTRLIETYSFYNSEGILLQKLEELLLQNGIAFSPRDFIDIFDTIYASKSNKYFSEFQRLCCTFITLFKSNNFRSADFERLKEQYSAEEKNAFLRRRTNLFLGIAKTIFNEYEAYLSRNNAIDFSDMINSAADKIASGCRLPPYRYVIVDEYQDISSARFHLIKAVAERTGARVFCVGDDWQAIYRFAGSDISLFTGFEKQFGFAKILKIEKTYRNSQNLIDEASAFVLKNPLQLTKKLRSDKMLDSPLVFWGFDDAPEQTLRLIIQEIVSEFGANASLLLLGRTNRDIDVFKEAGLFKTVIVNRTECLEYVPIPELPVSFLSVHKSKGLEADNVILLNFRNDKLGFPNQIADDAVLQLVLAAQEPFAFAEERRLFYVALTRTKNRTFILTDNRKPSPFLKEFSESKSVRFVSLKNASDAENTACPVCKTGTLLKIAHNGRFFVGCSNFPRCSFTMNDATILNAKKCPSCGGFLVKRKSRNGEWFAGCTNYPYCEYREKV